jgi:hypothetical protein
MATLVEVQVQGHQLNDIESHVSHGSSFVRRDTIELGGCMLAPEEQPQVDVHHRPCRSRAHRRLRPARAHQPLHLDAFHPIISSIPQP